jgi:hypothetical protein
MQLKGEGTAPLIEICPSTSYYLLGLRSYSDHPHIRKLLKSSYPFSLNTDDSGIFSTTISSEIQHMFYAVGMDIGDIIRSEGIIFCIILVPLFDGFSTENSLSYAFVNDHERNQLSASFWNRMTVLAHSHPQIKELTKSLEEENKKDEMDMSSLYTM